MMAIASALACECRRCSGGGRCNEHSEFKHIVCPYCHHCKSHHGNWEQVFAAYRVSKGN